MNCSKLLTVVGLFADIGGVTLLAWPIATQWGYYTKALQIWKRKKTRGWTTVQEDIELTVQPEDIVRATWFVWFGLFLAVVGFGLQIVGAAISK